MSATWRLLDEWEALLLASPAERAIRLAGAADTDGDAQPVEQWPVGVRDDALMQLRSTLFGSSIEATGTCGDCGESVELEIELDRLRSGGADSVSRDTLVDETEGWVVRSRLPTAGDLLAIESSPTPTEAECELWRRCIVDARFRSTPQAAEDVPAPVRSIVAAGWAEIDPLSDVQLDVVCPSCGRSTEQTFDILRFIWSELDGWARRLLTDIGVLARAYGWGEEEIVALSPLRRRWYLEMAAT